MVSERDDARRFWQAQSEYPRYGTIRRRRLHELNTLVPMLEASGAESLLDVGCGDGALVRCLAELTDIEQFMCCDFAEYGPPKPNYFHFDLYGAHKDLPPAGFVVFAGVAPFVFEDAVLARFLASVNSPWLYVRSPCSMGARAEFATGHSDKLGAVYSAKYRPVMDLRDIIAESWHITEGGRSYPDEIESEFGTKQYWFLCRSK